MRSRDLTRLDASDHDVLVVGGGIQGLTLAYEAASRGLTVALVEAGDFGGGTSFSATYTAYTSPNSGFTSVREIMFKLAVDDSAHLGKGALKPYVILAQEFGTEVGTGQADGGLSAGTYLELGVAPGYAASNASLAFPVKLGFSLSDYYELAGEDNKFGFFSVAAIATIPLGATTSFGAWNLHGGVEYQALGTTTEFFNGGESSQVIGSIGIGFSY